MDLNIQTLKTAVAARQATIRKLVEIINAMSEDGRTQVEMHYAQGKLIETMVKDKGYTMEFNEEGKTAIVRWDNA